MAGTQIGITAPAIAHRVLAQQHLIGQEEPGRIDIIATAEGTNNFRDSYSPAIGA